MILMCIIICLAILLFTTIICVTSYSIDNNKKTKKIEELNDYLKIKNSMITNIEIINKRIIAENNNIMVLRDQECERLSSIIKQTLEKTKNYNVDANLKM